MMRNYHSGIDNIAYNHHLFSNVVCGMLVQGLLLLADWLGSVQAKVQQVRSASFCSEKVHASLLY
jgi:hypothetical protein